MTSAGATPSAARLLRASALIAGSVVVARALNLGFRYLVAREMPVAEYGRVALMLVTANFLAQLGTWNLGNAAARHVAGASAIGALLGKLSRLATVTGALAAVACAAALLRLGEPARVAAVLGISVLAYALQNLAEGVLRAFGANWPQALGIVVTAFTRVTVLLVLVVGLGTTVGASAVAAVFSVGTLVAAAIVVGIAMRWPRGRAAGPDASAVSYLRLLRFGGALTVSSLVTLGLGFVNRLLLRRHVGLEEVAHYDNALLAYSALQAFLSAFVLVSIPAYATAGPEAAVRVAKVGRTLALFVAAWAGLFAAHRFGWTDAGFRAAGVAGYAGMFPVLLVILLGFPFELMFVSISGPLQARDRVVEIGMASCVAAVVGLGVAWIAIPRWEVAGAAVSTLSSAVVLAAAAARLRAAHGLRLDRR